MRDTLKRYDWYKVLETDELPEGQIKAVRTHHRSLCISHFNGKYGAIDDQCPQHGCLLSEGMIQGGIIICPRHQFQFCLLEGTSQNESMCVESYTVEMRTDGIYVSLPVVERETMAVQLLETMTTWGINHLFGPFHNTRSGMYQAIRRQEHLGKLHYISMRNEGAAALAASAYAKLTGSPAACLSTTYPGASQLLAGLWDAQIDHVPILVLSELDAPDSRGQHSLQGKKLPGIFENGIPWSETVSSHSEPVELMSRACQHVITNNAVAQLKVPHLITGGLRPVHYSDGQSIDLLDFSRVQPFDKTLAKVIEVLKSSEQPAIIAGSGVRFEISDVIGLAEALQYPVITTCKGKGIISDSHPLACGVPGNESQSVASRILDESDCLILFGMKSDEFPDKTFGKTVIQLESDADTLGKPSQDYLPVWGDPGPFCAALKKQLPAVSSLQEELMERLIQEYRIVWRAEKKSRILNPHKTGMISPEIFALLPSLIDADAIISLDMDYLSQVFGQYFECSQQTILMSGYPDTIGFAFPAAMGAWAATCDLESPFHHRQVISISGNAGFSRDMAELNTAVKYQMNITHFLINERVPAATRGTMDDEWYSWQAAQSNPDFAEYANNCGAFGMKVRFRQNLIPAIQKALNYPGPAIVLIEGDTILNS